MEVNEMINLVDDYGKANDAKKEADKKQKELNEQVKRMLVDAHVTEFNGLKYKAYTTTKKSVSFDEEKLIKVLEDNNINAFKKVVDEDALENAIYNGEVSQEVIRQINDCQTVKITSALYVKAV